MEHHICLQQNYLKNLTTKYGENDFILLLKYAKPTIDTQHKMYIMMINGTDQQLKNEEFEKD